MEPRLGRVLVGAQVDEGRGVALCGQPRRQRRSQGPRGAVELDDASAALEARLDLAHGLGGPAPVGGRGGVWVGGGRH